MYRTYITIGVALDVRGYIKVDDQIIGVYGCHPAPTKGSYMEINGEKRVVDEVKVDENWRWSAMFEEICLEGRPMNYSGPPRCQPEPIL